MPPLFTPLPEIMQKPAISLKNVSKWYGPKEIIHDISFDVYKGEIVGFLGPNGAGKTTTMKMISGAATPTGGDINVCGYSISKEQDKAARRLGYLPEHPPLYDTLSVDSYLTFVAHAKQIPTENFQSEIDRVIDACKLTSVFQTEIFKLSKGFRQRVGLAQAILGDPEILLLDEPTAGLDPSQIQETREVIKKCGAKQAVLLSTHILSEATLLCNRVAIINEGKLLAVDSPDKLKKASEETNKVSLTISGDVTTLKKELANLESILLVNCNKDSGDRYKVICHVRTKEDIETKIAKLATNHGNLYQIERQTATLENVFLQYIDSAQSKRSS
mgnify:CR=1 FL=1